MPTIATMYQEPLVDAMLDTLKSEWPKFQFEFFRREERMVTVFRVIYLGPASKVWSEFDIDDTYLLGRANWHKVLYDQIVEFVFGFLQGLGESITGKYPIIRYHADKHYAQGLLFNPAKDIPGWIFPKVRGYKPSQDEVLSQHNMSVESSGLSPAMQPRKRFLNSAPATGTPEEFQQAVKESNKMPATTKKKVIKTVKGAIDPSKIKKPSCRGKAEAEHPARDMKFDAISGKWRCTAAGCNMTARPKRDEDDRSVIIGKGGLQVRVIAQDGERSVMLVSDDNVALNITKFVDIEGLLDEHDAYDLSEAAAEDGRENFSTTTPHSIVLSMPLHIWGASELADSKPE